jgi:hypothetical protein
MIETVAHRMFTRNVADYADPVLADLAWLDPDIRGFWIGQATAVLDDVIEMSDEESSPALARRGA